MYYTKSVNGLPAIQRDGQGENPGMPQKKLG